MSPIKTNSTGRKSGSRVDITRTTLGSTEMVEAFKRLLAKGNPNLHEPDRANIANNAGSSKIDKSERVQNVENDRPAKKVALLPTPPGFHVETATRISFAQMFAYPSQVNGGTTGGVAMLTVDMMLDIWSHFAKTMLAHHELSLKISHALQHIIASVDDTQLVENDVGNAQREARKSVVNMLQIAEWILAGRLPRGLPPKRMRVLFGRDMTAHYKHCADHQRTHPLVRCGEWLSAFKFTPSDSRMDAWATIILGVYLSSQDRLMFRALDTILCGLRFGDTQCVDATSKTMNSFLECAEQAVSHDLAKHTAPGAALSPDLDVFTMQLFEGAQMNSSFSLLSAHLEDQHARPKSWTFMNTLTKNLPKNDSLLLTEQETHAMVQWRSDTMKNHVQCVEYAMSAGLPCTDPSTLCPSVPVLSRVAPGATFHLDPHLVFWQAFEGDAHDVLQALLWFDLSTTITDGVHAMASFLGWLYTMTRCSGLLHEGSVDLLGTMMTRLSGNAVTLRWPGQCGVGPKLPAPEHSPSH